MFTRHHRGKAPFEVSKLWHSVSEAEKKTWVEGTDNEDHSPMGAIRDNADEDLVCVYNAYHIVVANCVELSTMCMIVWYHLLRS